MSNYEEAERDVMSTFYKLNVQLNTLEKKNSELSKLYQELHQNFGITTGPSSNNGLKKELEVMSTLENHSDLNNRQKLTKDLKPFTKANSHNTWREQEARELSDLVQARLHALQNPVDCEGAKKLVCSMKNVCGFGCQIHYAIYCFLVALGTKRMLVMNSNGWKYNKGGWEDVFLPFSDSCSNPDISTSTPWPGASDSLVVELTGVESEAPKLTFLPPAIPSDLYERIGRIHDNPILWWISQFLKYMMRLQPKIDLMLRQTEEMLGFAHPIVGIHVRRTDKLINEASYHAVEEYMKYVGEYFQQLEEQDGKEIKVKRVYVASDDPEVLDECKNKYSHFTFLGNSSYAKDATSMSTRYSSNSLYGLLTDIHLLSKTDYLVCTLTSDLGKLAFEMMQLNYVDIDKRYKSLDDNWKFGGFDPKMKDRK